MLPAERHTTPAALASRRFVSGNSPAKSSISRPPLKFGFLAQAFSTLEQQPMLDLAIRDVACYIAPQAALTRSKDELRDILPNSFGLLGVTVLGMLALARLLRFPVARLSGVVARTLEKELPQKAEQVIPLKEQLARLAVSFGFYFPFAAGFAAVPFFRNYLTLKRTGTSDFETLIGLEGKKRHVLSPQEQAKAKRKQLAAGNTTLGIGAGLGLASLLGLSFLARRPESLSAKATEFVQRAFKTYALRGKKSYEVQGTLPILLFWLIPPSIGWILGARSRNERIEYAVKGANSILWFSLFTPLFVKRYFVNQFKKYEAHGLDVGVSDQSKKGMKGLFKALQGSIPSYNDIQTHLPERLKPDATKLKNRYSLLSWLIPVTMLAITPQLINIYFTKKRFEKSERAELKRWPDVPTPPHYPASQNPFLTVSPYHHKPHFAWLNPAKT
ncbi:MAG: hypothetical protein VKJ04_09540 [Vampirovibrionales bacterium]|nr:hypothetical protein [Vampirovibrionales bacterium]